MMNISEDIKKLVREYKRLYNEYPKGWDFKNESLSEYIYYLKKMINDKRVED